MEEARESLAKLRVGNELDLGYQFADMRDAAEGGADEQDDPDGSKESGGFSALIQDRTSRKALAIGVGLMFVQQLSGINAIMFYAGQIYSSVPNTPDSTAAAYSTGMQAMQMLITLASAFFMDRAGRVPILLFAAIGQFASC